MRTRRVLLVLVPTAAALAAAASAAGLPPGSGYPWGQPGSASVSADCTQPPTWVPIVCAATTPGLTTSYAWAQPGTASAPAEGAQPPASVPIAAQ